MRSAIKSGGGSRIDVIQGGTGSDTLYGGDGADVIMGSADDRSGNPGDRDYLLGGRGNDVYLLNGETDAGVEIIEQRGEGTDTILGDVSRFVMSDNVENYINDLCLNGGNEYVEITGNGLNNIIRSTANWDLIPETTRLDWMAININRLLNSTSDTDSDEKFFGMAGNDTLLGGAGDDYLSGGTGRDRLTGGSGADRFVFDTTPNSRTNADIITDFRSNEGDELGFDDAVFTSLIGGVNSTNLRINSTGRAQDDNDFLILNSTNGKLFYDADGSGRGAAVEIATLTGVNTLSHDDFFII